MKFSIISAAATCLIVTLCTLATAKEKTNSKQTSATKVPTVKNQLKTTKQFIIDPRTGEKTTIKSPSPSKGGSSSSNLRRTPDSMTDSNSQFDETTLRPYDLFDPDDGDWLVNSYLFADLSMKVYSGVHTEGQFKSDLVNKLAGQGIESIDIDVKMDANSGTEAAIFNIGNHVVFSFRGTSNEGHININPYVDGITDLNDDPTLVEINNKEFHVHLGFWDSTNAVFPWVLDRAMEAHLAGKKIWFTGHSLGGARATIAAMRLHYAAWIPVEGLITFGSPKVGDSNFQSFMNEKGPGDVRLAQRTERFVVMGDPATTFPDAEQKGINVLTGWVKYGHVGLPYTIQAYGNGTSFDMEQKEAYFEPTVAQ
ncbi:MAG: lipase family protein, partial [Planctomycetota bacterium]